MKEEYKKNLKHGYIFLIITLLIPFTIALSYEIHLNGGINLTFGQNEEPIPTSYPVDTPIEIEGDKVTVIIRNLSDGYKTKETSVTLVGLTQKNNEAWVNGNKVNVAGDGQFELKIDLAEGENKIEVVAKNKDGEEAKQSITVIREVEKNEEPKVEPTPQYNPPAQSTPQPQPAPVPMPTPTPTPEPQPTPITGLKLSCSITNTAPTSGSTVSINCTVKDQNNNGASGAFGYVTLNWKTGSSVYTLSQSDGGGNMSTSFTVPSGNTGSISGNVQASKDGLNINSNFNLNVQ